MYQSKIHHCSITSALLAGTLIMSFSDVLGAQTTCNRFDTIPVANGQYNVQTNEWNATNPQCLSITSTGFTITQANFNLPTNGPPATYPSIYKGCHWVRIPPEGCRSAFRTDVDHDSEVMPISVPN